MLHFSRLTGLVLCLGLAGACFGQDPDLQKKINRAIDKGVTYLKEKYEKDKDFYGEFREGMNSLIGWTLLEAGAPIKDRVVQKIAQKTRQDCINLDDTYSLTLAILFLDRLGDPWDEALIQAMAARLMSGQTRYGTWDYKCLWKDEPSRTWLKSYLAAADKERNTGKVPAEVKTNKFPEEIEKQLRLADRFWGTNPSPGDHSNTQFAMLGLWVARRHGMPVDNHLRMVVKHFRESQHLQGSWGYRFDPGNPKGMIGVGRPHPAMTCAGLLGLALDWGISDPGKDLKNKKETLARMQNDPLVREGLNFLAQQLKAGEKSPRGLEDKILLGPGFNFNYFLFSMERMAVVYKLEKIAGLDWYQWGAQYLVSTQNGDNWDGRYRLADTCFALLFLKRANVAGDLGKKIELKIDIPGLIIEKEKKTEPEKRLKEPEKRLPKTTGSRLPVRGEVWRRGIS